MQLLIPFLFSVSLVLFSGCEECVSCEINGVRTEVSCHKGADYDAYVEACEEQGGTVYEGENQ